MQHTTVGCLQYISESKEGWEIFVLTFYHSSGRPMPIYPMKYDNTILIVQKGNKTYLTWSVYYNEIKSFKWTKFTKMK